MTRLISIVILVLHFYYYCYGTFYLWGLSSGFSDRLLRNITDTGLFDHFHRSKLIALVSNDIPDRHERKNEKLNHQIAFAYIITGLLIYLALLMKIKITAVTLIYIGIIAFGTNGANETFFS